MESRGPAAGEPAADVARFESLGVERAPVPAFSFVGEDGLERLEIFAEKALG